jgi:hypothetical protein
MREDKKGLSLGTGGEKEGAKKAKIQEGKRRRENKRKEMKEGISE